MVFADVDGHIGYQCVGRIPVRQHWQRGYRKGWDPAHQWQAVVPYAGMPALSDPPHGWIRSANNRTAPEDFPYRHTMDGGCCILDPEFTQVARNRPGARPNRQNLLIC